MVMRQTDIVAQDLLYFVNLTVFEQVNGYLHCSIFRHLSLLLNRNRNQ